MRVRVNGSRWRKVLLGAMRVAAALLVGSVASSIAQEALVAEQPSSIVSLGGEGALGSELASGSACGERPLAIARMQWPSSAIMAYIHAAILAREYDCEVQVIDGDLVATTSQMVAIGQPAIIPELWVTRIAQIWNSSLESQSLRPSASTFSGGAFEGWFVLAQMVEQFPALTSASDLSAVLDSLAARGEKLTFISCPSDWACSVINENLLQAHGLAGFVDQIVPGNRIEMDALIGQAMSRGQPTVFYYWQPNPILAQFDFRALEMGDFDAEAFECLASRDCFDPKPSAFVSESVFIVAANWVEEVAPQVGEYLLRASMPLDEMNKLMAWQAETERGPEEAAARFVEQREEVWRAWVESE